MYVMHGVHEQPFQKMAMGALMQVAYASVVQQSSLYLSPLTQPWTARFKPRLV